jgi:ElaB/YqjD/DUF883 family membrane-anchored ribosome-binding protein
MQTTTGGFQDTTASSTLAGSAEKGAAKIEQYSGSAHHAVDRVAEAAASALRHAGEKGEELVHLQDEWLEGARGAVRRHPVASVVIAVGVGLLFSRFTSH